MMGVVNVVLLMLLVWTFTSVCEDDDDITIKCEDVTAPVGAEINLACTVSYPNQNCYMIMYKFIDTAAGDICKEQFSKDLRKQENRFSCPYTAKKAMTKFKFYLQTSCGAKTTEFSVIITGIIINCEDVTAYVGDEKNLACTVSSLNQNCYMTMYKFTDTAATGDICKEQFSKDLSNQENRFSCPYTANKAMTKFKFYLQTSCGAKTTEFSVSTTDIIINCEDVTAYVGDEINLACNVSHLNQICYMTMYKFTDTAAGDVICKEQFSKDLLNQERSFSCPYTTKKPMTKFKFYLQTTCGQRTSEFSLSTTDMIINCEDVTAPVGAEINLACNVSHLNQICYTTKYKFTDTAAAAGDVICKEQFSKDLSKQESRLSCPYTAKSTMTRKFKFYLQTTCGQRTTDFIVKITDIKINCEDVTARVGDEINLTCTVRYLNKRCCGMMYKFIDTAAADDPTICREDFRRDSCKQELRFSCTYTANKAMTTTLKFFLQSNCGSHTRSFTANIAGAVIDDKDKPSEEPPVQTTDKTTIAVVICLLSCFVIVIVALFLWMRRKTSRHPPDYNMGVSRPPQDYNMAACENNISEPSDEEAALKETSVNAQTVSM